MLAFLQRQVAMAAPPTMPTAGMPDPSQPRGYRLPQKCRRQVQELKFPRHRQRISLHPTPSFFGGSFNGCR